ncbi:hypothetical protein BB560_002722 [Smittium megazygosporum]|uniref:tryptophan--tRNA ligase n=1 Tax=Smittium megazygosporum TaxID=133381 RepID=A0A2T9ZE11_9FUNG|nr:hypothetical protein BB560_002722 [Smittium megazygosporum]
MNSHLKSAVSRIVSGIQPTGIPHLGNYLGSIQNWIKLQNQYSQNDTSNSKTLDDTPAFGVSKSNLESEKKLFFFIADLHSLTSINKDFNIKESTLDLTTMILACGIDPKKSVLFKQSAVPAHSELMWILSCITPIGQLNRMTQWKSKAKILSKETTLSSKNGEEQSDDLSVQVYSGLFMYPVLQAADILLYQPTHVPVGEDQSQHLELTRDLADYFNRKTGTKTFVLPETLLTPTKRIMSLKDPLKKMSKSDTNAKASIFLTDSPNEIKNKILKAKTDLIQEIYYDKENRPGVSNLIDIYSALDTSGKDVNDLSKTNFSGLDFKSFKSLVADMIIENIHPIQKEYNKLKEDPQYVADVLKQGSEYAAIKADDTMLKVKTQLGLL